MDSFAFLAARGARPIQNDARLAVESPAEWCRFRCSCMLALLPAARGSKRPR